MATKSAVIKKVSDPTLQEIAVRVDRWKYWRDRRNVKVWYAALLTMNIEPSPQNRTLLRERFPDHYQIYRDRVQILISRSSTIKNLKFVRNPFEGTVPQEKLMALPAILAFIKNIVRWPDTEAFVAGMSTKEVKALDGSRVLIDDEFSISETSDLPKGLRYTYVRYAAMVFLLKLAITDQKKFTEIVDGLIPNRKTSNSALGLAIQGAVAQFATGSKKSMPSGFRKEKNAKEIALAAKVLKELF